MTRWCRRRSSPWAAATPSVCRSASARAAIPRARPRSTRCWSTLGREGKRVVRLKSGDPLVFGRAGEEMQALRDAGIAYEVVPGVTAAFAAAADFELPLTLRGVSSSLVFTTGHDLKGETLPDWAQARHFAARPSPSIWAARSRPDVADRLIEAGLSPDTAVAVVENASLRQSPAFPRHARRPAVAGGARRPDRPGHDHHRRCRCRRQFRTFRAARGSTAHERRGELGRRRRPHEGAHRQSAHRRHAVWYAPISAGRKRSASAEIARDKAARGEARSDRQGRLSRPTRCVDVNLIDVRPGRRCDPRRCGCANDPRRRPDQPQRSRQAGAQPDQHSRPPA